MFEVRKDEPGYAFIPDVATPEKNQWGKNILTTGENNDLAGKSLNINDEAGIGSNPNRYKQHGFHFTADNCIGCHACEAACSEKNELPAYLSFRSVGYVEGGSYPAFKRLNISMACNHCDDPVCLKGCPTRAYTKYAEYGAVLQDPETCFGCGYCTWVCPYNAPQLDLVQGEVSKCNMCVDRLEVGLKPACAAACLGGALDFGLIETTPENRDQAKVQIPGFPTPTITKPNIRFQQVKSLPKEMTRTDTMPLRYQRDEQGASEYKTKVKKINKPKQWGLPKLRSREDPLVMFTLITQGVIGALILFFLSQNFASDSFSAAAFPVATGLFLFGLIAIEIYGLYTSTMHLGKPHRFYRAFNNLKYSPVSREVAAVAVFFNLLLAYSILYTMPGLLTWLFPDSFVHSLTTFFGFFAMISGPIAIYAMHKIYRIEARPFWNHWQVLTAFYGNMLSLGAVFIGLVFGSALLLSGQSIAGLFSVLAWPIVAGLVMEAIGLYAHAKAMEKQGGEGAAAMQTQNIDFGKTYLVRNISLVACAVAAIGLALTSLDGYLGFVAWTALSVVIMLTALVGRALFYVLVIPTTMPGAFFWRNQGFQEHARAAGLANMPQTGVLPDLDFHQLAKERAMKDIKASLARWKEEGLKAGFIRRWQERTIKA